SLSATTAGADLLPSSRLTGRPEPGGRLYRAIAAVTIFAMLFGGLLLLTPMEASAASATTTARLNLRSGPGIEHDVLTVIPDGAQISVDGDIQAGYYPVTWNGTSGFAVADFIQIGGSTDPGSDTNSGGDADSGDAVSGGAPTGTAWVDVARLNLRSGPSTGDGVISVLAEGTAVELTGQQANGYWQATANGTAGWLYADYLTTSGPPATPDTGSGTDTDSGLDSGGGSSVPVGGTVTGSATVDANLNLRLGPSTSYAVVRVLRAGTTVELRGNPDGEYYPVAQNSTTGWAHGGWLSIGSSEPDPEPEPDSGDSGSVDVGDTVTGSGTTTANLNMRTGPSTSYSVVLVIPQGAAVDIRGAAQGEYLPVSYNGASGWAHGSWISADSAAPDPEPTPDPAPGDGSVPVDGGVTGTATVTANLNLRRGPSTDHAVITVLRQGSTVEVRGAAQGEYYPVSQNGTSGWAHGGWLSIGAATPDPEPESAPGDDGGVPVGDSVTGTAVATANLNLRSGPSPVSYGVIRVIPQGATVEIRGALNNGYYPVVYDGTEGWAASGWLQIGGSAPAPAPSDGNTPNYLYTTVAQNMRSQPTTSSAIVWVIPPGTRLDVIGAAQNGWYPVRWAHVSGWMLGDYLSGSFEPPIDASDQWIVDIIYAAADRYGQPRADMLRVAECESHLDPNAVNPISGTSGLFQFRPGTWATTPYASQNIFDPVANANAAAWMWSVGRRNEWACQ
ncbi:MAG TPA: SH3 domain-containing protein, partial [Cryptosporangiaceae bacterium]|nr:SH3 domain-containing protein [Cryptosporangiaceae bacterium]